MQVEFTREQEEQLSRIADDSGADAKDLVRDAGLRLIEEDARFRAGVERGILAAERGEFVEHADVWTRVEAILRS